VALQRLSLRAREAAVETARDRAFRLVAGQCSLEVLAQSASRFEHERLHVGRRQREYLRNLHIGAPLELAHDERRPLVEREVDERTSDLRRRRRKVRAAERMVFVVGVGAGALAAGGVGEAEQPGADVARAVAASERAVCVDERALRDLLGLGRVAQHRERVPVDVGHPTAVETLECAVPAPDLRETRRHPRIDAAQAKNLLPAEEFAPRTI